MAEQQTTIDSFRNRTGLLLSTAAITTSFLGAQAFDGGDPGVFVWLAMTGFVGVAVVSLAILWPRRWEFTANAQSVIQAYAEAPEPVPIANLRRDASLDMHSSFISNKESLERLAVLFQAASILLTVEVALWIVAIAST